MLWSAKRMKVAYILPISWGAIPHYTAELANAVSKYASVVVLKPKDSNTRLFSDNLKIIEAFEPLEFSRIRPITVFSPKNLLNFSSYRKVKLIEEERVDIVHFPELYPHATIFTFLYQIHKKMPVVVTLHSVRSLSHLLMMQSNLTYRAVSFITEITKRLLRPQRVIVQTRQHKEILVKRGIAPQRVNIIPQPIFTIFKNFETIKNGREVKENSVLLFGYLSPEKGIEDLIKATSLIARDVPNIKIIIAGEGDFTQYSKLIKDWSIFEVYNEYMPDEKVAELFNRAKVVVLPYRKSKGYSGSHSGVLSVALYYGKALIVTDVGQFEIIKDGVECLKIPPRNPQALAEAVVKILKDDKLRDSLSKNALKKAEELSPDNIAKMHVKVYEEVLNEWRKRNQN